MSILISITFCVITVAMKEVSSYTESCIGEYCFTTPDSSELRNFDWAKSWCASNISALAIVSDDGVQLALTQFLNPSNSSSMTFINIKVYQQGIGTWFLVNGPMYNGNVGNQARINEEYKLYCCMKANGNNFQLDASQPNATNRYICEFQDSNRCSNNLTNSYLYNGRCYVKYENATLTWFQARERCHNNGGDLASFQTGGLSFETSWLNPSMTYWVGFRWKDWRWKSSVDGNETIYTSWSSGKPNNTNYQCVCVDPNGIPVWSWTDCSCDVQRPFVCLKKVVPTITSTTTATTSKTTAITKISEVIVDSNRNSTTNALAIGLGAGLGGGVFIIILVVLVVIVVMLIKKRRRKNNEIEPRPRPTIENTSPATTPNIELATSNGFDVYAKIVPTTNHPESNTSKTDVIYAQPEFTCNQNFTSSGSYPINIRQAKGHSIMLEGSTDVHSNATSAS